MNVEPWFPQRISILNNARLKVMERKLTSVLNALPTDSETEMLRFLNIQHFG